MKECVVVQYYVRNYKDENILHRSLDSYVKLGLDIILISHSPIPIDIQKKVKYFIYDSDDELITFEDAYYNPKVIVDTIRRSILGDKLAVPFLFELGDISYSFYKAVYDVYKFVQNMGYDYSYYFIGDSIINEKDIETILNIRNDVLSKNKMGYFEVFKPRLHLSPFFWYVNNKWFLDNGFLDLSSKNNFFNSLKTYCVYEKIIYDKIIKVENDVIIKELDSIKISFIDEDRFDLSKKVNTVSYNNDIGLFYDKDDGKPYIVAFNFSPNKKSWRFTIEYNNKFIVNDITLDVKWKIIPIQNIESKSFRIRCDDLFNKKVYYDIFIDDIDYYKQTFKIMNKNEVSPEVLKFPY